MTIILSETSYKMTIDMTTFQICNIYLHVWFLLLTIIRRWHTRNPLKNKPTVRYKMIINKKEHNIRQKRGNVRKRWTCITKLNTETGKDACDTLKMYNCKMTKKTIGKKRCVASQMTMCLICIVVTTWLEDTTIPVRFVM